MNLVDKLQTIVPAKDVLITEHDRSYARLDMSTNVKACMPHLVVRVNTVQELIDVVTMCLNEKTPVVMRGAGTGKSGGAVGNERSVVIDTTRLNNILLIDKENLLAEVEPGVVLADLQKAVMEKGLYYPPDPASSASCTLGGNVAENAAGPSTLKYGTTRDYVLGGQAILGTGELVDFGKRCPKGVAGYDIAALLCGSEGSLAVITKLILRLLPLPKSNACAMFFFGDEESSLSAVNAILNAGHLPKTLEYIDTHCLQALSLHLQFALPNGAFAALIIECDAAYLDGAKAQIDAIHKTLLDFLLVHVDIADDAVSRKVLWQRRSLLSEACTRYQGHKLSEDVAVPLGSIAEFGRSVRALGHQGVIVGIFGHAGDGNLHVQIMFDDQKHLASAQKIRHEVLLLVLKLSGTITAEHGVGLQKKAYLPLEQSPTLIELQKRIKTAFDPHYLLNPGKIFDP